MRLRALLLAVVAVLPGRGPHDALQRGVDDAGAI
jgi:hypothetical protein